MPQVADAVIRLVVDEKQMEKAVSSSSGAAAGAAEKGGVTLGTRFGNAMSKAAIGAGAAAGTFLVAGIESAMVFEDQLRTINTVAKVSDAELSAIGDSIQSVSRETGKTTDDLAAGYYDLVSAGVAAKDATEVLRASAILSVGALGTTGEAVDAVTSALNAYDLEASEATRVTDVLALAVQDGKVTIAEIGSSIANIAPIAASAGISLEEVSAGYALLTAKGVPAAQAATQMRAAISALLTPNESLNRIQEKTGINFAKLAKQKGLGVALERLRKSYAENGDALAQLAGEKGVEGFQAKLKTLGPKLGLTVSEVEKLSAVAGKDGAAAAYNDLAKLVGESQSGFAKALGSVEALNFALVTTGPNAADYAAQVEEGANASGIALGQYEEKSKSALEQGKRLVATITTFAQDVGGPFVSTLGSGIFALNQLGQAFGVPLPAAKILGGVVGGLGGKLAASLGRGLASSATTAVADSLATGVTNAAGSGKLGGAMSGLGRFMGSKLGMSLSVAFAAVAVFEVVNTYNQIKGGIEQQNAAISDAVATKIQTGTDAELAAAKAAIEKGITELNGVWDAGLFTNDARSKLQTDLAALDQEIARRASGAGTKATNAAAETLGKLPGKAENTGSKTAEKLGAGMTAGAPKTKAGATKLKTTTEAELKATKGTEAGQAIATDVASGLAAGQGAVAAAAYQLGSSAAASVLAGAQAGGAGGPAPGPSPSPRGNASGGVVRAGVPGYVNEKGWELFVPEVDGRVLSHQDSMKAAAGAAGARDGVVVNVYNPTPERASTSTERELRKLAYMGVLS